MKATDVFNERHTLLGKTSKFEEAFPGVAEIKVIVDEDGEGVWRYGRNTGKRSYTSRSVGEYVDCSNPRCYNGGFNIGQQIRFMMDEKKTRTSLTFHCQGYEGSPKGRKKSGPCFNFFKVDIEVSYKD
jgi:hypothetical protein